MIYFMSIIGGKRLETVPVKFSQSEKAELIRIAKKDDRGLGYVVRELAFRGLAAYKRDGLLKLTSDEEKLLVGDVKSPDLNNAKVISQPKIEPPKLVAKDENSPLFSLENPFEIKKDTTLEEIEAYKEQHRKPLRRKKVK